MRITINRAAIVEDARQARMLPGRVAWARFLVLAMMLAGAADAATTQIALGTGFVVELNPLMRGLQGALGAWWIAIKMTAHLLLAAAVLWYPNRPTLIATGAVAALTFGVALNNLFIYDHVITSLLS